MFDKLVESDLNGADLKPRRRIFAASFIVIGLLFASAVVAGIYAADYTLGTNDFDIVEMLAPVATNEPAEEPEPVRPQDRPAQTTPANETSRQTNMARTDEPTIAPSAISVSKNSYLSRPPGTFLIRNGPELNGVPISESDRHGSEIGSGSGEGIRSDAADDSGTKPPPPPAPKAERKPILKTGGVVNGSATYLPKPTYSAAAQAIRAVGTVNVQVTIDENGKVISAQAVGGHIMLRQAAVDAAWKARFKPTTLSGNPVKVSGVIVYNFTR